jgi:hypothetical protein
VLTLGSKGEGQYKDMKRYLALIDEGPVHGRVDRNMVRIYTERRQNEGNYPIRRQLFIYICNRDRVWIEIYIEGNNTPCDMPMICASCVW